MFESLLAVAKQKTWWVLGVIVIILALVAGFRLIVGGGSTVDATPLPRTVQVASVAELSGSTETLRATGIVEARSEAELRAETPGTITGVYAKVGSVVSGGALVAEVENASQRASVAQAQARVASAEAALAKVQGGTRSEQLAVLAEKVTSAENTLENARDTAHNALLSAYAATDSAIPLGVDSLVDNAERTNPVLRFTTSDYSLKTQIQNDRIALQAIVDEHRSSPVASGDQALLALLSSVEQDEKTLRAYIDRMLLALDKAVINNSDQTSTIINGYITTTQSSRTALSTSITTLTQARAGLNSALSGLAIALQQQAEGVTGAQDEDVASAQASLQETKANLALSVAQLEKTRVRAAIGGTITTLSVKKGDFVGAQQALGIVANQRGLEVRAFIPARERTRILTGSKVLIDGRVPGVVTSVAPGIDPTRGQVEVLVSADNTDVLTHGASVSVLFERTDATSTNAPLALPIAAISFIGEEAFVFSVNQTNTLVAVPVTIGDIVGRRIIVDGLDPLLEVVTDARGLAAGDSVSVAR